MTAHDAQTHEPTHTHEPARTHELAQVNVSRLLAPLTDPRLADFVAALEPVNAAAEAAPGYVWRLQTEDGDATSIRAFQWHEDADSAGVIVNMSVWTDVPALAAFVYGELHRQVLRRRREWFPPMLDGFSACWWVPSGHRPTTDEAEERVQHLVAHGPTPHVFTLRTHFPPPGAPRHGVAQPGHDDWLCPI